MEPSTSGRDDLSRDQGQLQGSAPTGALQNALVGYDMSKRYAPSFAWLCCPFYHCSC